MLKVFELFIHSSTYKERILFRNGSKKLFGKHTQTQTKIEKKLIVKSVFLAF